MFEVDGINLDALLASGARNKIVCRQARKKDLVPFVAVNKAQETEDPSPERLPLGGGGVTAGV